MNETKFWFYVAISLIILFGWTVAFCLGRFVGRKDVEWERDKAEFEKQKDRVEMRISGTCRQTSGDIRGHNR